MTSMRQRLRTTHGQSMVEYLAIAGVILVAILALQGPITSAVRGTVQRANGQLTQTSGTVDSLLR